MTRKCNCWEQGGDGEAGGACSEVRVQPGARTVPPTAAGAFGESRDVETEFAPAGPAAAASRPCGCSKPHCAMHLR